MIDLFSVLFPKYKINKPIALYELFAGIGTQRLSLNYLGVNVAKSTICEWAVPSIEAYKKIHCSNDNTDYSAPYTHTQLIELLNNYGISQDYNKPMSVDQIKRKSEEWCRQVYNNIRATNNLVDVSKAHLEFDSKYCNIMTYSFPCQDLSLAGLRAGIQDGTRSGLLKEVERILDECENKPDILLLENVPPLLSDPAFPLWIAKLQKLGYSNYTQKLNSKDYGVPQNRERVFVVSIKGEYSYDFPQKIKLTKKLKDLLEDSVDERYFLSDKMVKCFMSDGSGNYPRRERFLQNINRENQDIGNSITTLAGNRATDNFICNKAVKETLLNNDIHDGDFIDAYNRNVKSDISGAITTRVSASNESFISIKTANSTGYMLASDGDGVDVSSRMQYHRGTVQKGMAHTINTCNDGGVVVSLKRGYDCEIKGEEKETEEIDVIGNYSKSNYNSTQIVNKNGVAPVVRENHGQVTGVVVGQYDYVKSDNFMHGKDRFSDSDIMGAMTTKGNDKGVVVRDSCIQWHEDGKHDIDCRAYFDDKVAPTTTTTTPKTKIINNLRIRKLTPRECFRLMGVRDEDFDKIKDMSDARLYHLAGDSIVVDVLENIFKGVI